MLTHNEGPWAYAWRWHPFGRRGKVIPVDDIRDHFVKVAGVDADEIGVRFNPADIQRIMAGAFERAKQPPVRDDLTAHS